MPAPIPSRTARRPRRSELTEAKAFLRLGQSNLIRPRIRPPRPRDTKAAAASAAVSSARAGVPTAATQAPATTQHLFFVRLRLISLFRAMPSSGNATTPLRNPGNPDFMLVHPILCRELCHRKTNVHFARFRRTSSGIPQESTTKRPSGADGVATARNLFHGLE